MKVNDIDMDAVILGNGEYPTHSMPETMLIMAPYVVCCDGSADEHIRRGFTPDAIIATETRSHRRTRNGSGPSSTR